MPFHSTDIEPGDVKVTTNIRLPLSYRNQLVAEAAKRLLSLNALLMRAIEKEYPCDS